MKQRYERVTHKPNDIPHTELIQLFEPHTIYRQNTSSGLELVVIENDFPWCDQDLTVFALGESNPRDIRDLNQTDCSIFFGLIKRMVNAALASSDCLEVYTGIGFNPDDNAPGCHTVKRLHAHVCLLDQDYLDSRTEPNLDNLGDWYYRMVFFEPFIPVFYDYTQKFLKTKRIGETPIPSSMNENAITMRFPISVFGSDVFNGFISDFLQYLHDQYRTIESIFTDRSEDPVTDRFIPYSNEQITAGVVEFLEDDDTLTQISKQLLLCLARNIKPALPRSKPDEITRAEQLWAAKGFSGALIMRFTPSSDEFMLEFYPKVLATQALTRGNGLNSGALTDKDGNTQETDPLKIAKMETYIRRVRSHLID